MCLFFHIHHHNLLLLILFLFSPILLIILVLLVSKKARSFEIILGSDDKWTLNDPSTPPVGKMQQKKLGDGKMQFCLRIFGVLLMRAMMIFQLMVFVSI